MHILFLDESGTAPEPAHAEKSPMFVLGGLAVSEDSWVELALRLNSLKIEFGIVGEIKWRYFNRSELSNHATLAHLSIAERNEFRRRVFKIIWTHAKGLALTVVVQPSAAYASLLCASAEEMYEKAFQAITHEFSSYLIRLSNNQESNERGLVVADHRNAAQDERLRTFHHANLTKMNFESHRLVEGLFFSASHLSVGTQLADFIAGASFRKHARNDEEFWNHLEENTSDSLELKIRMLP